MKMSKRTRLLLSAFCVLVLVFSFTATAFAAEDDPIQVVNNLSDFSAPVSGR